MLFGKILNSSVYLRGLILLIFISINNMVFSQTVDYRRVENSHVINTITGDTLSSHTSDIEAVQQLQNYKVKGLHVKMIGAVYDIDILNSNNEIVKDTFTTIADYILLDYTNSLIEPTDKAKKYALVANIGLVEIESDTIYRFQKYFKLARERGFGYAKYKSIGLPFQFRDSVNYRPGRLEYRIQTFATKIHGVKYYVDNILEFDFSDLSIANPGQISSIEWRHTHIIKNLQPGTKYLIRVEGNSEFSEIDFKEFYIKTLE